MPYLSLTTIILVISIINHKTVMKNQHAILSSLFLAATIAACSGTSEKNSAPKDLLITDSNAVNVMNDSSNVVNDSANVINDSSNNTKDQLLIPGKSAGNINLGQNAEEVYLALGKADAGDAAMQKSVAIWYKNHDPKSYATSIYTVRDTGDNPAALIQQIRLTSPDFQTNDNIGVNSTLKDIQKKYTVTKLTEVTEGDVVLEMYDSLKGIAFETDKKGVCRAIIIHKAGESLKTTSLPLR